MLEAELYPPLKRWFEAQDYQVRGEVKHCDLVAEKADELVIVELKIKPSLKLLYQASERLSVTDQVFVGLPGSSHRSRALTPFIRLLKLLGIGLILIKRYRVKNKIIFMNRFRFSHNHKLCAQTILTIDLIKT